MISFDRAYCINLDRRPERWEEFSSDLGNARDEAAAAGLAWPLPPVERFSAVDCEAPTFHRPDWWGDLPYLECRLPRSRKAAYACYLSHCAVLRRALECDSRAVLIFEDDVFFRDRFARRLNQFWAALPADWDMVFLGGNVTEPEFAPPTAVNDQVVLLPQVVATHAYAVRGGAALEKLLEVIEDLHWIRTTQRRHAIDRFYEALFVAGRFRCYGPRGLWLCGQTGGWSDIRHDDNGPPRFWDTPLLSPDPKSEISNPKQI